MTGKTHASIGVFSALAIFHPVTVREAVFCVGVAAIGSVICDVDVSKSDSRNKLNHIVFFIAFAFIALLCVEKYWQVDFISYVKQDTNLYRILLGFACFLGICIFGTSTPHRSFMHSLLGMFLIGSAIRLISVQSVNIMLLAMASHIAIDSLNHKKVRLFYPAKVGISLGICKSDGKINDFLFLAGMIGSIGYVLQNFFYLSF